MTSHIENFGMNIFKDRYITITQDPTGDTSIEGFKILSIYKGDDLVPIEELELDGWDTSSTYNGYPLVSEGHNLSSQIKLKADKSLLFNDLRIRFAKGPMYWTSTVRYQDKNTKLLVGKGKEGVGERWIQYTNWVSVLAQYLIVGLAMFLLAVFINDFLNKFFESDKTFKSFIKLARPYFMITGIFIIGSVVFYHLNKFLIEESFLSLFSAVMTKNDVFIVIAFLYFAALGLKSYTINNYKHMDKLTWFIFIINPLVSFAILELAYNPDLLQMEPIYVVINTFILLLVQLLVYFISRKKRPAMMTVLVISMIFGICNDFLMVLRDSPLIPAFLGSLGVAADVAGDTVFSFNGMAMSALALGLMWMMVIMSVRQGRIRISRKKYLIALSSFAGVLAVSIIVSANFFLNQVTVGVNLWRPSRTYYVEGAPYSFYRITVKQLITAPDGYKEENVKKILDSYYYGYDLDEIESSNISEEEYKLANKKMNDERKNLESLSSKETSHESEAKINNPSENLNQTKNNENIDQDNKLASKVTGEKDKNPLTKENKQPNVIMIQSESLADYYNLGNLRLNKDPLEFTRSLKENTIQGHVYMSVLGGGTVNSEYETLTSLPLSFFPSGAYPFQQYVKDGHTSVGRLLENQGYDTFIAHPNKPTNYSRQEVWPNLGFENLAFIDDYIEGPHSYVHDYISDDTTYRKIIDQFENKSDKPLFYYLVTMQNHGAYMGDNPDGEIEIIGHKGENLGADEYLNLVKASDHDFKNLVEFFKNYDEPTIICIFGDHQPSIYNYYLDIAYGENNYKDEDSFKTPLTIWANYDIEEEEDVNISLNYLSPYLFSKAGGIKVSAYDKYLLDMMEEYPVLTTRFILDKDGRDVKDDQKFLKKNNELDSLVYYSIKDQDKNNKYFNFPAEAED